MEREKKSKEEKEIFDKICSRLYGLNWLNFKTVGHESLEYLPFIQAPPSKGAGCKVLFQQFYSAFYSTYMQEDCSGAVFAIV